MTGDELADALQAVGDRGASAVQRNLWRFLHAAFEHGLANREAKRRFRLTGNPVSEVEKPDPPRPATAS